MLRLFSSSGAAFAFRDFRLFFWSRFFTFASYHMLAVAVGQYVYEATHSPLHLGTIGLALFLPRVCFVLFIGHAADRFDRRHIIVVCRLVQCAATVALIAISWWHIGGLLFLYGLLFIMGTANAFDSPASQSFVPDIVPTAHFPNAVTWNASAMQIAMIAGPALGGWIYAWSGNALIVFAVVAALRLVAALLAAMMTTKRVERPVAAVSWSTLMAGVRYLFVKRVILGAISLDLFAVLLGGAVALMPIFANDLLGVGPAGLGVLRAAPACGAAIMALMLAAFPLRRRQGSTMFCCVAIFGLATMLFGLSRSFALSLLLLMILGAADMVSVVIRGVLVQMETPPAMRGRVSAINLLFIGASNELGEFESGVTAAWFGTVPAVVIGGVGTVIVAALWAWRFPELRCYTDRIAAPE